MAVATANEIDTLAWTAVFGADAELAVRRVTSIRTRAAAAGIRPASIHDLYLAMGRGETAASPCLRSTSARWRTTRRAPSSAPRTKLNAGAFIFEIARSEIGYTEQRPARVRRRRARRRAARRVQRADLHPGRSRPDERQEVQQPRAGQRARHASRADQGRDRGRFLQRRHRHVDARRSRQTDARGAAGSERHARGRLHRRSSARRSRRASPCRSAARSERSAARTPTSTSSTLT